MSVWILLAQLSSGPVPHQHRETCRTEKRPFPESADRASNELSTAAAATATAAAAAAATTTTTTTIQQ